MQLCKRYFSTFEQTAFRENPAATIPIQVTLNQMLPKVVSLVNSL